MTTFILTTLKVTFAAMSLLGGIVMMLGVIYSM